MSLGTFGLFGMDSASIGVHQSETRPGGLVREGTYRTASGVLVRCRVDRAGATRCEVELADGRRREVEPPPPASVRLLSDDPAWLSEDAPVALGADE